MKLHYKGADRCALVSHPINMTEHGAETRELLKQSTMDLQLLNTSFHFSVAHEPNG